MSNSDPAETTGTGVADGTKGTSPEGTTPATNGTKGTSPEGVGNPQG